MKKIIIFIVSIFSTLFLLGNTNITLISSFDQLPKTQSTMSTNLANYDDNLINGVGAVKLTHLDGKDYSVEVDYGGITYKLGRSQAPATEGRNKEIYGYYWTDFIDNQEQQFIMFFEDGKVSDLTHLQALFDEDEIKPFQVVTVWNLTTGEFYANKRLIVYGAIVEISGIYYLDVVMPLKSDDLISITVNYSYMKKYIFGITGKLHENITYTAVRGDTYLQEVHSPAWTWYVLSPWLIKLNDAVGTALKGEQLTQQKITKQIYSIPEKDDFVNRFNEQIREEIQFRKDKGEEPPEFGETTVAEVFNTGNDGGVYRVYLDQIGDWFQTGIDFHRMVITDIAYLYQGKIYQVNYHYIDSRVPDYIDKRDPVSNFLQKIKAAIKAIGNWFEKNKWWFIGFGVVALVGVTIYFFGPSIRMAITNSTVNRQKTKKSKKQPFKKNKRK